MFPDVQKIFRTYNNFSKNGSFQKRSIPPTEEIFAVRRGREEKCLRMSEGGGERKNVLGCPKGGEECGYVCLKV